MLLDGAEQLHSVPTKTAVTVFRFFFGFRSIADVVWIHSSKPLPPEAESPIRGSPYLTRRSACRQAVKCYKVPITLSRLVGCDYDSA